MYFKVWARCAWLNKASCVKKSHTIYHLKNCFDITDKAVVSSNIPAFFIVHFYASIAGCSLSQTLVRNFRWSNTYFIQWLKSEVYNDSVEERSGTTIPALLHSAQSPLNHFLRLIWTPETQPALYTAVFHYKTQFVLADEADWSGP